MPDAQGRPLIFISYSHNDTKSLDYVREFLGPIERHGVPTIWDDERIQHGGDWKGDILSALAACDVFILLVSNHSLKSKFINEVEVARIQERRQNGERVAFCPIVVTPTVMEHVDWLMALDYRPKGDRALSEITPKAKRDREMKAIVQHIVKIIERGSKTGSDQKATKLTHVPPRDPANFDYNRLPVTPYERLVGRDEELNRLDQAWADDKTNIISLIAWGGAGKTALVNEWLARLRMDNYRGADAVLGWSFYSQGTKERATSAEGFLDWALAKLNVKTETTSSSAKGEKLAEAMAQRRVLMVLDGVEPLQYGPDGQKGALKDQGLRSFLRRFAAMPPATAHGLVVLTSRLAIHELQKWKADAAPAIDLARLSDEAGAALLADNGVKGARKALEGAAHDFEGHALALSLLASFLRELHGGDVRQRDRIRGLLDDPNDPGHDHARRVMESYEKEWLSKEPALFAIMNIVGLFDRPATAECLEALRRAPAISGLADVIVDLDDARWRRGVARLRDVRLLDPEDSSAPGALDAHPLVREWFGERLKRENEKAWGAAHSRLYEHLRDSTRESSEPSLQELAPLYQAIAHGCQAGRYVDSLSEVLWQRIYKRNVDGDMVFYAKSQLGAYSSSLAAISWFFDVPFDRPVAKLSKSHASWVISDAATSLRALGRFGEALPAMRVALNMAIEQKSWRSAARRASNLSQTELLVGDIQGSVASGVRTVELADLSGDRFSVMTAKITHADALHSAGQIEEAARIFLDAEADQKDMQPEQPRLYSVQGYQYCDVLLTKGDLNAAEARAAHSLAIAQWQSWLLDIALDTLTISRAQTARALTSARSDLQGIARRNLNILQQQVDSLVDGLIAAGEVGFIARGLLVRSVFLRVIGDENGAARDLDLVEEISEPGPMRLHLCDMALERARLAFAQIEAFAPLNGMLEKDNPPKPEVPSAEEIAKLREEAGKQIKIADDYIQSCGYHRRDEELAELKEVLAGKKTFASLPPRV